MGKQERTTPTAMADECWLAVSGSYPTANTYLDATTLASNVPGCIIDPTVGASATGFAKCDTLNGWAMDPLNVGSCIKICYLMNK